MVTHAEVSGMQANSPLAIEGVRRHYQWGSATAIPTLTGSAPDGRPVAELWFGDHPSAPSPVPSTGSTLDQMITADPEGMLGPEMIERFGSRLPFLLKILAADKALSIQAHPNLDQARAGFAAEEAAGIPRDAPHRTYRDANHKPELLCALTPFDAMCGFRPRSQTLALLAQLALPELDFLRSALEGPDPLRRAFTAVVAGHNPGDAVGALTEAVACVTEGPLLSTRLVAQDCEGDVGIVLSLLLNYIHLQPGESVYLGAGNLHSYLRGTAVEIMANSDNVLRCGLTPKHVDVDELLRITDFTELADPRSVSQDGRFLAPVADFGLTRLQIDTDTVTWDTGPQIVLCTSGSVRVGAVDVASGGAAFVPAGTAPTIVGQGVVFVAGVGAPTS